MNNYILSLPKRSVWQSFCDNNHRILTLFLAQPQIHIQTIINYFMANIGQIIENWCRFNLTIMYMEPLASTSMCHSRKLYHVYCLPLTAVWHAILEKPDTTRVFEISIAIIRPLQTYGSNWNLNLIIIKGPIDSRMCSLPAKYCCMVLNSNAHHVKKVETV